MDIHPAQRLNVSRPEKGQWTLVEHFQQKNFDD
jgi:hypothetical protein